MESSIVSAIELSPKERFLKLIPLLFGKCSKNAGFIWIDPATDVIHASAHLQNIPISALYCYVEPMDRGQGMEFIIEWFF